MGGDRIQKNTLQTIQPPGRPTSWYTGQTNVNIIVGIASVTSVVKAGKREGRRGLNPKKLGTENFSDLTTSE